MIRSPGDAGFEAAAPVASSRLTDAVAASLPSARCRYA